MGLSWTGAGAGGGAGVVAAAGGGSGLAAGGFFALQAPSASDAAMAPEITMESSLRMRMS